MRQYEPIWNRIKTHNHASIVAPVESHSKIKKAVIKEKHMDEGYKLLLSEKALRAELVITSDKSNPKLITFSLDIKIVINNIGVNDL